MTPVGIKSRLLGEKGTHGENNKKMDILVACEYSGIVREAFSKRGHRAISCDIIPTEKKGNHYEGMLEDLMVNNFKNYDMVIAFPPCTHLCVSGARWWPEKKADGRQKEAIDFFMMIANSGCKKIAIENPVGIMSTVYKKPTQIINPWQFGHGEQKKTCLWLKGLPKLEPTNIVKGREQRIWKMPPSKDRSKLRSKTYQGIADAMAEQWG